MRPNAFAFTRPATLADALRAMAAGAVPLAGGQSLLQAMRLRQSEPAALVDLASVAELNAQIVINADHIAIGAHVTHRMLAEHLAIARELPWLTQAALALGDVQVRNLGTVLGNLCWADPRANMAVALLASDAAVTAVAPERPDTLERIPLADFFAGFRQNALNGRLATSIEVPRKRGSRGCYIEFSRQRQDLALCNVCVVDALRAQREARVAVGGIAARPLRLPAVEEAMAAGDAAAVSNAITQSLEQGGHEPIADSYGSAEYKLRLAGVLVRRVLDQIAGQNHD